jgi:16S rRNA (cytosine967-C5)-methyltransferase
VDVEKLPGFFDGKVSVQDVAAQLAAPLLDAQAGMRVLDACAAPGGKTAHILEHTSGLKNVTAMDIDSERLKRVEENLQRLSFSKLLATGPLTTETKTTGTLTAETGSNKQDTSISLLKGDASEPDSWWDKKLFDRILLDAPCSATGVIRRHPDIKVLRREEDITELARRQAQILDALWPLLVTGGMLLYATCSIMKRENVQQIQDFLQRHSDARERIIKAEWGEPCAAGRQILPGEDGMDGFYYACLEKLQ